MRQLLQQSCSSWFGGKSFAAARLLSSQYSCPLPKLTTVNWHKLHSTRHFEQEKPLCCSGTLKKNQTFLTYRLFPVPSPEKKWKPWMIQTTCKSQHLLSHTPNITGLELLPWRKRNSKDSNIKQLFHKSHRLCGQGWKHSFGFIYKR